MTDSSEQLLEEIDPLGRPLSPVSVEGMHRRNRHRARRRGF